MSPNKKHSNHHLSNAPLVEAILEVRWKLVEQQPGFSVDPAYKLLVGRLYDRLEAIYPFHEPLPTASLPDEMLSHKVTHRFRSAENGWPLVQLGPGIITFNDTKDYGWDSFREQGVKLVEKLFEIYPKNQLSITHLQLRYINAVSFNIVDENIITYIKDNLKIGFDFPKELFSKSPIQEKPSNLNTVFSFPISDPNGTLSLKLANGKHENTPALIWEIIVQSVDKDIPKMPESFENWFTAANTIIHNTFFNLIEGSLEKKFK